MYSRGMHPAYAGRTGRRGLGDDSDEASDFGFEDDGSTDTSDQGFTPVSQPTTIALSNTSIGTGPVAVPPPLVNYTPGIPLPTTAGTPTGVALTQAFKNPDGSPTYDGAPYSATDLLNPYNLSHLFGGLLTTVTGGAKPGTPLVAGAVAPASTIGGVKTSTLALLAGVGVVAYLVLGRKS
ncbi:MAG TPA: hypothetical protein VGL62_11935 [Vicinamibacterales bacterium]|jgi:hypothetical protein